MALINQNLETVEESQVLKLLIPGEYELIVENSEIKEGAKGEYIAWTFDVIGHPNKIWDNMSLGHPIGLSRLKSLAIACNHPTPNFVTDTEELHGKSFLGIIKIVKDKNKQFDDKNGIQSFKKLNDDPTVTITDQVDTAPVQMPWDNK